MKKDVTHFLQPPLISNSPFVVGDNQLIICNGVNPSYELGVLIKDLGYSQIGETLEASKPIRSLFDFRQTPGTAKILATVDDATSDDTQLFYFIGSAVSTTTDASSASGQKVVNVTSTVGFTAGDTIILAKGTANEETKIIDTIQAGISLTTTVNLTNTHASGVAVAKHWTEITGAETAWANEATNDVEMESFITYCFFVGYSSTDGFLPVRSLTGTTIGTTNTTSMPGAKYIKRYRDRLYLGNCDISGTRYPYRVYFSSVPSGSTITWTVASDFIDVDFSEEITGLAENWDRLIIFTEFRAYMYDQVSKKKVWDVGCAGHRTIQNIGSKMIFANKDNVYLSNGSEPVPIGSPILELIRNSSTSNWKSAVVDNEYYLYLGGSVSAGGQSYSNLLAVYNTDTNMWRWRELYDNVSSICRWTNSGNDFLLLGMADGEVMIKSKYSDATPVYGDDGQPVLAHWRTKAYDLGDASVLKKIKAVTAYTEFGNGMTIRYRIYDKNREVLMPFNDIGSLSKVINVFDEFKKLEGNFIQFEGKEFSTRKAFRFFGFTFEYEGGLAV